MKSRLIARDLEGAREDARWALDAGAADSDSPIGRYAAALALLVRSEDARVRALAESLVGVDAIPPGVTDSLIALATSDEAGYERAIRALLADFETRDEFLEDVAVADTVVALQVLAAERGSAVPLTSPLLPS